jgi:aspartyl-tRNA(Asn)/glutamyl-tRNA(Gln) amidotransferase subunit C
MKISKDEVLHVAHLARLTLSEEELNKMTGQLDNILSYFDKLRELDTDAVPATSHVFSISNAFREDEVRESLPREEALRNCARQNGETFQVPRII